MAIYLGVSLPQVHYQDWNVKTFLYQSTLVLPGMPQLAVLKLLLSFISNGSGKYLCSFFLFMHYQNYISRSNYVYQEYLNKIENLT